MLIFINMLYCILNVTNKTNIQYVKIYKYKILIYILAFLDLLFTKLCLHFTIKYTYIINILKSMLVFIYIYNLQYITLMVYQNKFPKVFFKYSRQQY